MKKCCSSKHSVISKLHKVTSITELQWGSDVKLFQLGTKKFFFPLRRYYLASFSPKCSRNVDQEGPQ